MSKPSALSKAVLGAVLSTSVAGSVAQAGAALDRITAEKFIRFGIRTDAAPFSSVEDGQPKGFSVELCSLVAGAIMATSKIEELNGEFIPVDTTERFDALQSGKIDVLCGATTATLSRRESVSFSLPTFATGLGAAVSADASDLVQEVLVEGGPAANSKAALAEALGGKSVGARTGTTAADWLDAGPLSEIDGIEVITFDDHAAGIAAVREGRILAYFADRSVLVNAMTQGDGAAGEGLAISRMSFTYEPYALALPRGDEDLRLAIDRALSFLYGSGQIFELYERHFGKPTAEAVLFYRIVALPE